MTAFEPLRTGRLLIRRVRADDAEEMFRRNNHPDVARYETWELPFPRERIDQRTAAMAAMPGPADDQWWMATVASGDDSANLGEVAVRLGFGGRSAEIGYTLAPEHWGHGYAVEAVEALLTWLFEVVGIHRAHASLHPDNVASAQVLERTGFVHEGHTRESFWVGDEVSDDDLYGLLRPDWEGWRKRPVDRIDAVELVPVTPDNDRAVYRLATHHSQRRFVAPMEYSFADALVPEVVDGAPVVPWYRGVRAGGEMVAFVMLAEITSHHPEPYLWRLLVDRRFQRRGAGRQVLDLVVDQCRAWGATTLLTSWTEGRGSPRPFYERYGFVPTGRIVDDETEARLTFP